MSSTKPINTFATEECDEKICIRKFKEVLTISPTKFILVFVTPNQFNRPYNAHENILIFNYVTINSHNEYITKKTTPRQELL